jgi:hypothetical protein
MEKTPISPQKDIRSHQTKKVAGIGVSSGEGVVLKQQAKAPGMFSAGLVLDLRDDGEILTFDTFMRKENHKIFTIQNTIAFTYQEAKPLNTYE